MRRARNAFFALAFSASLLAQSPAFDVLITGGRVLDGTGAPPVRADVAVRGGRIDAVGLLPNASAALRIDARGLVIAPGFIDIHTHARWGIFAEPAAENYIRQGVTTLVDGNDGNSPVPLAPFLVRLARTPVAPNFAMFAGQGSIREAVLGTANRRATAEETRRMRALVRQAMLDGAFGVSTGLFYVPGSYTPTEEIIELAREAGRMGGIYISHMRDEAAGVVASVEETIRVAEEARLPAQVTHHKIVGAPNWGRSRDTLRLIEQARARGIDVTIDQYPYTASSTALSAALFPQWSLAGGRPPLLDRLAEPAQRDRIRSVVVDRIRSERGGGDPKNIVFASCPAEPGLEGRTLADAVAARGLPVTVENAAAVAIGIEQRGDCSAIFHAIAEEDVERILLSPYTMIASDGEIPVAGGAVPHPRSYGTFARVLGRYVRERRILTLEEAVRKMTGLPASRLGLRDRGLLHPGMQADLVVFDPSTVADRATFANPRQFAAGFSDVLVNGVPVVLRGALTAARPGRILYGPAHRLLTRAAQ